jgi:hypothetical protein
MADRRFPVPSRESQKPRLDLGPSQRRHLRGGVAHLGHYLTATPAPASPRCHKKGQQGRRRRYHSNNTLPQGDDKRTEAKDRAGRRRRWRQRSMARRRDIQRRCRLVQLRLLPRSLDLA